jgi:hypothetical protein
MIVDAAMGRTLSLPETELSAKTVPPWLRTAGLTVRCLFIATLLLLTFCVSLPQSETIETAYDTPNDLIRLALGFAVCVWLAIQLFRMPRDAASYRTWLYLFIAAEPFALICLYYVW